ncbi:hypothetical protein ACJX0J_030896, partial [Zea mays]
METIEVLPIYQPQVMHEVLHSLHEKSATLLYATCDIPFSKLYSTNKFEYETIHYDMAVAKRFNHSFIFLRTSMLCENANKSIVSTICHIIKGPLARIGTKDKILIPSLATTSIK